MKLNAALHFRVGSALREFVAGRLGTADCWPAGSWADSFSAGAAQPALAIARWENEGGRILT